AAADVVHGINGSGWAPAGLSPDVLKAAGFTTMPQTGIHAVTVAGAVAGWEMLRERFGRSSFEEILGPAIHLAEAGFPMAEPKQAEWAGSESTLRADPIAQRTYLPLDRAPGVGECFRNPDLAWTYRQLAANGRDAFYRGAIAERILACSAARGGI